MHQSIASAYHKKIEIPLILGRFFENKLSNFDHASPAILIKSNHLLTEN
jgi:hypothetical protein